MLCCPVCNQILNLDQRRYVCPVGHSFDLAKEGYVNLLPANQKHSHDPGDTKEMVLSRRAFLQAGHYKPFAEKLGELVRGLLKEEAGANVIDIGCGEGYYTGFIKEAAGENSSLFGFDISKWAVKYAAKKNKDCAFAVASAFHIPAEKEWADLAVNLFSPLAVEEIYRVLKGGGYFIYAVPGPRHLFGLKEILYDAPYENQRKDTLYNGFNLIERVTVKDTIHLERTEDIMALFTMTPYYWKTPGAGAERLARTPRLDTQIHFDFLIYQKEA